MSALYPLAKQQMLQANVNLATGTVKAALIDTGLYTYSAAHQYYSSVSAAVLGTPQELTSKTFSLGIFDAADVTFGALTGNPIGAVVIYVDSGVSTSSPLIACIDQGNGLPLSPSGGNATITWNASGIFQL